MSAQTITEVFTKVVDYVSKLEDVQIQNVDSDEHTLYFTKGSVWGSITLTTYPEVEEVILVLIRIPVVINPRNLDEGVLRDLLHRNLENIYGGFGISREDNSVWLCYTLLGNTLDIDQLNIALITMSVFADTIDEELCALTGGERGSDFLRRLQSEE